MRNKTRYLVLVVFLFLAMLSACQTPEEPEDTTPPIDPPNGEEDTQYPEEELPYTVEEVFSGQEFDRPLDIQNAEDSSGRIFVVEQGGRIHSLSGEGAAESQLFLDISDRVDDSSYEKGLLGLAFHPDFAENGLFYVNYTDTTDTVIARFSIDEENPEAADPASEEQILTFDQPYNNHNGGQLAFGPDGYLYIATGDGGGAGDPQGHGQDRSTLHGNILRIDVDTEDEDEKYAIPPDNPYAGNTRGFREEIYAYGFRNPWRFSFDERTGNLWAADVGQDRVEEINLVEKGKNYGWNIMEGSLCFDPATDCDTFGLEMPVFEYHHPIGRSITGGYVYRGERFGDLYGAYIYGDFVTGMIWALWYDENSYPINATLADTNLQITSFGLSEENELYLSDYNGKIYTITQNQ
ncbi:PQQ-dependent sugar dehydrogenase [Dethiobacter alkaliphilus]|uniref:Glucose sorbosone dehydrogenase n=1 Tax=Dethiobacter alkaliphilus AHT 1 TaxID=555088 RepID=C0GCY8_DETAL|nr:PQQ-dependent sugar dehydrogenase [Dethiobacter alkaliphilus]EEG79073.1 glucose sorbosone dehydrogenase [Dethiobacter alkaliphilus AHT 1]